MTGGAASKLAKIKFVRKSIARVLTVYNQTQKDRLRLHNWGKYKPTDLREKKTRAIRRQLTTEQVNELVARYGSVGRDIVVATTGRRRFSWCSASSGSLGHAGVLTASSRVVTAVLLLAL